MSMNINASKIGANNVSSSRTPHIGVSSSKQSEANGSVFNNRKSPVLKQIKKVGLYQKSNRPPRYIREVIDPNSSSLPIIMNALSISKKKSADSQSPELLKRYELKGRVMKPSQRLANLRGKNKVFEWFI
jgi:hypothetical protein